MTKIAGSMVAIVTPMSGGIAPDSPIDWVALDRLLEFHIDNGTDGIVAVGTTGESATLSEEEHCQAIKHVVDKVAGRIPVVAGTGANSTSEAVRLTQCAKEAGADACLLVTPYYNKPTQQGLIDHHSFVAEAVDIPQILYNVPGRTACDMSVATITELAKVPNIVGVKEATGEVERVSPLREGCGEEFLLLSGDDLTGRDFMLAGGDGVISVTANVAPKLMNELCAAALAGDAEKAAEVDDKLVALHRDLFVESNPIPVKWAMHKMGYGDPAIRLPLTWLPAAEQAVVAKAMAAAGI
ncbi:MAG: 4-hydroxy-tetrahydrodipicolinate synthase [Pseudomonadota bacterium]